MWVHAMHPPLAMSLLTHIPPLACVPTPDPRRLPQHGSIDPERGLPWVRWEEQRAQWRSARASRSLVCDEEAPLESLVRALEAEEEAFERPYPLPRVVAALQHIWDTEGVV